MSDAAPSRIDDYLDVFVAPSKLFERRSDGKFGQALLVLVILVAIIFFATKSAMEPIMDAMMAKQTAAMERTPNITPEQLEQGKKFGEIGYAVSLIVGTPIAVLVLGLVILLVAKVVGGTLRYAQGATIATFAMFPHLVGSIVSAVQALLMDESKLTSPYAVSLGLGRLMGPATANPVLQAAAGRVEVFTIWVTILIAIGLKVMAKATTAQAVTGAVIIWVVGALPAVVGAMFQ